MKYLQAKCLSALVLLIFLVQGNPLLAQQADFSYTAVPATMCNPVTLTFKNNSTGNPTAYSWDFGDGRTSHDPNPQITYTASGPKKVTLVATFPNGNSTYYRTFEVGATPQIAFSADVTNSCKTYTANFTDATPNATARTWDFGDGTAPVTTANAFTSHAYTKAGKYDVTLTVTNSNGCQSTLKKTAYITISQPEISLDAPLNGCVPYTAAFNATSTNDLNDPVAEWKWNFGDGSTATTTTGTTAHPYTQTGTYNVSITIRTAGGCEISKTFNKQVRTGNPPSAVSFTATPADACVGEPVRLIASAQYADSYNWDYGDGTQEEVYTNDIRHGFTSNGTLTVKMKAGSNGCYTPAAPVNVTITGPVSQFTVTRDCNDKNKFTFTNTSTGTTPTTTYQWDFGDNTPVVGSQHATHTYTTPDKYTVRLTVSDNGNCNHSSFQTVYDFKADFSTGVSAICRGSKATYEVLNVPVNLVADYTWHFGDGTTFTTTDQRFVKTWAAAGSFTDQLVIRYKDPGYCDDIVTKPGNINILAPQADFATASATCAGQPVSFTNTSAPSPNIPIANWQWDFGNGKVSSAQTPPATTYSASGGYPVKLVITDARNCQDSVTKDVTINPTPFVKASAAQAKICEGNNVTLHAQSDGSLQWLNAATLSCAYCADPVATPVTNTRYLVEASNVYGCTMRDSTDIAVVPKVNLTVSKDTYACYGSSVQLQAGGATIYDWTPVTGLTNNTIANPVTTPTEDMVYQVRGTNDPMCPMSAPLSVKVAVKQVPSISAGKSQTVVAGDVIRLMASGSSDIVKWQWSPTDYLDNPTSPFTNAAVRKTTTYSITGTNQYGCTKSDVLRVDLICNTELIFIPNTFSPNGDGVNDIFYLRGKGISLVKSFRIFNRLGQEVFHRENIQVEDINAGWNGTFNGQPQGADVYIYFVEAYCDANEFFRLKGNVTLLR
ncbi:PKD domain-containing protein [Chitinophaga qingshengii]|uniref:PKD domain-containing protein n=1 Tax=Chitinophaga qingshengii TaxID=1569794 RepID=A0ABR7TJN6_9BACT|nr:PKD domain-containing protein [Chitinophaga qingshengii]MBC9930698.1 PKD domain-containing protein [Chitinophaga qingshengii]